MQPTSSTSQPESSTPLPRVPQNQASLFTDGDLEPVFDHFSHSFEDSPPNEKTSVAPPGHRLVEVMYTNPFARGDRIPVVMRDATDPMPASLFSPYCKWLVPVLCLTRGEDQQSDLLVLPDRPLTPFEFACFGYVVEIIAQASLYGFYDEETACAWRWKDNLWGLNPENDNTSINLQFIQSQRLFDRRITGYLLMAMRQESLIHKTHAFARMVRSEFLSGSIEADLPESSIEYPADFPREHKLRVLLENRWSATGSFPDFPEPWFVVDEERKTAVDGSSVLWARISPVPRKCPFPGDWNDAEPFEYVGYDDNDDDDNCSFSGGHDFGIEDENEDEDEDVSGDPVVEELLRATSRLKRLARELGRKAEELQVAAVAQAMKVFERNKRRHQQQRTKKSKKSKKRPVKKVVAAAAAARPRNPTPMVRDRVRLERGEGKRPVRVVNRLVACWFGGRVYY